MPTVADYVPDQGRVAAAPGMPRATRVSGLPRGSLVRLYSSAKSASLFSRSVSVISGGSSSGHSSFQLTATRAPRRRDHVLGRPDVLAVVVPLRRGVLHRLLWLDFHPRALLVFLGMFEDVVDRVNESLCVYHFGSFLLPNAFGAISIISYTTGRWKYQAERRIRSVYSGKLG